MPAEMEEKCIEKNEIPNRGYKRIEYTIKTTERCNWFKNIQKPQRFVLRFDKIIYLARLEPK